MNILNMILSFFIIFSGLVIISNFFILKKKYSHSILYNLTTSFTGIAELIYSILNIKYINKFLFIATIFSAIGLIIISIMNIVKKRYIWRFMVMKWEEREQIVLNIILIIGSYFYAGQLDIILIVKWIRPTKYRSLVMISVSNLRFIVLWIFFFKIR